MTRIGFGVYAVLKIIWREYWQLKTRCPHEPRAHKSKALNGQSETTGDRVGAVGSRARV